MFILYKRNVFKTYIFIVIRRSPNCILSQYFVTPSKHFKMYNNSSTYITYRHYKNNSLKRYTFITSLKIFLTEYTYFFMKLITK